MDLENRATEEDEQDDTDLENQFLTEENVEDMGRTLQGSLNLQTPPTPKDSDPTIGIDSMLKYMNQILMEDDTEDTTGCTIQGSLKLQEAEKSLYEAIGNKYLPSSTVNDISGSESVSLFNKGVEEASKLIPNIQDFLLSSKKPDENNDAVSNSLKGRKHGNGSPTELQEQGRRSKQANAYGDPDVHSDTFDEILLHHAGDQNKTFAAFRDTLQNEAIKKAKRNRQEAAMTDLRRLLINCAEAVALDDRKTAQALLNQIRRHSSPIGDGSQRLAHYLANGLEARLAGNGSQIYRSLVCKRPSVIRMLKAYQLNLAACPFTTVSLSFSNITIWKQTRGAARIHIIDFGIHYGFQWPTFIQQISKLRDCCPPRIRITGIEFPQPGFRPAERVEETGRRLAHYAKEFNVPFEFNPIAKRWETIKVEDLRLDENELVVVNCIYRMKNMPDETTLLEYCSRSCILNMIRKTNPVVFIQGVVNGSYNAPSFLTRFKEAFSHFSTHFDMLDSIVPRESEDRVLLEREVLGREAFNVMACEGWDRVERPETYKQWHTRNSRAGFVQFPLDPAVKDRAKFRASAYCKEFVIDQDGQWLILGWKGKILYALSTWKPA